MRRPTMNAGIISDTGTIIGCSTDSDSILVWWVPVVPSDFTGTIPAVGTIQPALKGNPHCTSNNKIECSINSVGAILTSRDRLLLCRGVSGSVMATHTSVAWILHHLSLVLVACCPPDTFGQKVGGRSPSFRQAITPASVIEGTAAINHNAQWGRGDTMTQCGDASTIFCGSGPGAEELYIPHPINWYRAN